MKGAYGVVKFDGPVAVKCTDLFDENTIMGCNICEPALGLTVCKETENIINFRTARSVGDKIEVTMDKGGKTLFDYIITTPFLERMKDMKTIVTWLINGLNNLHTRGIAHCDFKPTNIIMAEDEIIPIIIDLGSARYVERARDGEVVDVVCTYAYAAPEALEPGARPTYENDAYSLGVILYMYIYKMLPVDGMVGVRTREDACRVNKEHRRVVALYSEEIDPLIYKTMIRLLETDPQKRPCITDLYDDWIGEPSKYDFILDQELPLYDDRDRISDIDKLFKIALSPGSFPLAVSIRDRSGAKGAAELEACAVLAHMTLYPDTCMSLPTKKCRAAMAMKNIINRVGFALYTDTAEWVLWMEHGVEKPDPKLLTDAIKDARGDTMLAVHLYLVCM